MRCKSYSMYCRGLSSGKCALHRYKLVGPVGVRGTSHFLLKQSAWYSSTISPNSLNLNKICILNIQLWLTRMRSIRRSTLS